MVSGADVETKSGSRCGDSTRTWPKSWNERERQDFRHHLPPTKNPGSRLPRSHPARPD